MNRDRVSGWDLVRLAVWAAGIVALTVAEALR